MCAPNLKYTTKEINSTYKIKVSGVNFEGPFIHKLVGVRGLVELLGVELANNLLDRAFESKEDKCTCKLRSGLKVTFYTY